MIGRGRIGKDWPGLKRREGGKEGGHKHRIHTER